MNRELVRNYPAFLIKITFPDGSDVCEYSKEKGGAERWHDVPNHLLVEWSETLGYTKDEDLFDFMERTVNADNCGDLVKFIEARTAIKSSWVSFF